MYNMGRAVAGFNGDVASYPDKKRDIMFSFGGTTAGARDPDPNPTTNIACSNPAGSFASQCIPVYPENGIGGARNYFNVLIREAQVFSSGWPTGSDDSFWLDYTNNDIPPGTVETTLIPEIQMALDQSLGGDILGVRQTPPFDTWWGPDANPSMMNFYVSVQDPRRDPEGLRGFFNCANIDLLIDINDAPYLHVGPNSGSFGARQPFYAFVSRPGPNATGWGDTGENSNGSQRVIWLREPFGSIGALGDEFFCASLPPSGGQSSCPVATTYPGFGYNLNTAPPGCSDPTSSNWCSSSRDVSWLKSQSESNPLDFGSQCWSYPGQTDCQKDPACYWIAGIPGTSYYSPYDCIPQTVSLYDIGVSCDPNASCYLGGDGFDIPNYIDSAQPGDSLMQQGIMVRFVNLGGTTGWTEQGVTLPGFGGATAGMAKALSCLFWPSGCNSYPADCVNFLAKWDGGWYGEDASTRNPGNLVFMQAGAACQNGVSFRR
jgi:hypothetical protein